MGDIIGVGVGVNELSSDPPLLPHPAVYMTTQVVVAIKNSHGQTGNHQLFKTLSYHHPPRNRKCKDR